MKHVAVSALGNDRTGIVAAISRVLFETGCNIEDSSMTLLAGEFAMILIVAMPRTVTLEALEKRLIVAGRSLGLSIGVRPLSPKELRDGAPRGTPYIISVYGADRPGIVARISRLLADNAVNITDVQTKISGKGKKPLYIMLLEVDLQGNRKRERLEKECAKLSRQMSVSISLHPCDTARM